jgi:hypothetical protein
MTRYEVARRRTGLAITRPIGHSVRVDKDALEPGATSGRQRIVRRFAYVVVAIALAGCSHSSGRANSPSTSTIPVSVPSRGPSPIVTSRLEVESRTIKAGAPVRVFLVIDNRTGYPIRQPVCHSSTDWQAYLTNGHDASGPLPVASGRLCDRTKPAESVPIGESRVSYTTHATYFGCAPASDSYPPTPKCLQPGDRMPPLPAGRYTIAVNESPYVGVPRPAALHAVIVG